jgi:hypothetical protein
MIEIDTEYEIIVFNNGDRFKGSYHFYDKDNAIEAYEIELKKKRYDNIIFNEVQMHTITQRINS